MDDHQLSLLIRGLTCVSAIVMSVWMWKLERKQKVLQAELDEWDARHG